MLFNASGDPATVEWYRADDAQPWLPVGNQFVSDNWINRDSTVGQIGEQPGGRPWRNGFNAKQYPVQTEDGCFIDGAFVAGLETGQTTGPWDATGKLGCCTTPLPPPRTEVDCGGGNFVCPMQGGVPTALFATLTGFDGCPEFNGVQVVLTEDSPGSWSGSLAIAGKTLTWFLDFCIGSAHGDFTDGITLSGQIACVPGDTSNITGGTWTTAACDPFELVVDGMLLDVFAFCCFQVAGFTCTITGG